MCRRIPLVVLLVLFITGLTTSFSNAQETIEGTRRVVTRVTPQYPTMARSMRLSGNVKVEALVAANGTVKSVEVKGGHPVLAVAAQNAIHQWKWEPAAHETHELVEIRFNPQ